MFMRYPTTKYPNGLKAGMILLGVGAMYERKYPQYAQVFNLY